MLAAGDQAGEAPLPASDVPPAEEEQGPSTTAPDPAAAGFGSLQQAAGSLDEGAAPAEQQGATPWLALQLALDSSEEGTPQLVPAQRPGRRAAHMLLDSEDVGAVPAEAPAPARIAAAAPASLPAEEEGPTGDASAPATVPNSLGDAEAEGGVGSPDLPSAALGLAAGGAGAAAVEQAEVQPGSQGLAAPPEPDHLIEADQAHTQGEAVPEAGQPSAADRAAGDRLDVSAGAAPEQASPTGWHVKKRRPPPDAPPQQALQSAGTFIPHNVAARSTVGISLEWSVEAR